VGSDDVVREIKDQADIVSVVGRYLDLKRRGRNYIALCPFHNEKTPSFTVSPEKELFHCFGCGKGGDVLAFVMEMEGMDFPDALKMLAREGGVEIPERSRPKQRDSRYRELYELNSVAMDFYHGNLLSGDGGSAALSYLEKRGISSDTVEEYRLGYAPEGWDSLVKHAKEKGLSNDLLIKCGLAVEGKGGVYDYFRQRIIFPIKDNRGRLAGFAGREFGGAPPKYLNSPDTPIFNKRKILYGYHDARPRIRTTGEVLIVEGYTDLIALLQEGEENVVAPMGTALTDDQAALLSRVAKSVILVYDRDEAGLKATFRAGDIFLKSGMSVKVVQLPEGEDPDSFVLKKGIESFRKRVSAATDIFDLKNNILEKRGLMETVDGRRKAADYMLGTIGIVKDDLIRDMYLGKASEALGIDRSTLENILQEASTSPAAVKKQRGGRRRTELQMLEGVVERYLIQLMISGSEVVSRIIDSLSAEDFSDPRYRRAFEELALLYESSGLTKPDTVMGEISEELHPLISELYLSTDELTDPDKILQDCLRRLEARRVKREMEDIEARLQAVETSDDGLAVEYYELKKRLVTLQSDSFADD